MQWRAAGVVGTLLLVGGNGGVVLAQQSVASGVAAIAVAVVPVFAALFAGLWGRWPGRAEWVGLGVGLAGVAVLNLDGGLRASPFGAMMLVAAPLCWALGSVWSRALPMPAGLMSSAAQMLAGGVLMTAIGLAAGERIDAVPGPRPLAAYAYLTVFGSLVAFSAYAFLLQRVRPTLATSYAYVNPIVAVALGALFAGERVDAAAFVALPLILAGVALVAAARNRKEERR